MTNFSSFSPGGSSFVGHNSFFLKTSILFYSLVYWIGGWVTRVPSRNEKEYNLMNSQNVTDTKKKFKKLVNDDTKSPSEAFDIVTHTHKQHTTTVCKYEVVLDFSWRNNNNKKRYNIVYFFVALGPTSSPSPALCACPPSLPRYNYIVVIQYLFSVSNANINFTENVKDKSCMWGVCCCNYYYRCGNHVSY